MWSVVGRFAARAGSGGFDSGYARACALMLFSGLCGSLAPLTFYYGGAEESPLTISGFYRGGAAIGCIVFLTIFYWRWLFRKGVIRHIGKRAICWSMLFVAIGYVDFTFYALALQFVDISVVAILSELGPLIIILVISRLVRERRPLSWGIGGLALLCFAGAALVVAGQRGFGAGFVDGGMLFGCAIALCAAVITSGAGFVFPWATRCAGELLRDRRIDGERLHAEIFCIAAALLLANVFIAVIGIGAGAAIGEQFVLRGAALALGAGLLLGWGGIAWRVANLLAGGSSILAMMYFTPALAAGWIILLGITDAARVDYLMLGVALIVGGNLAIGLGVGSRVRRERE